MLPRAPAGLKEQQVLCHGQRWEPTLGAVGVPRGWLLAPSVLPGIFCPCLLPRHLLLPAWNVKEGHGARGAGEQGAQRCCSEGLVVLWHGYSLRSNRGLLCSPYCSQWCWIHPGEEPSYKHSRKRVEGRGKEGRVRRGVERHRGGINAVVSIQHHPETAVESVVKV